MTDSHSLVDHLFRERAGQMVAWLTRAFGPAHMDLAEEVVQEALVKALQQWPYTGVPANPGGWLFRVARNRALDVVRRDAAFRDRAERIATHLVHGAWRQQDSLGPAVTDDELRMIFLCCHPGLPASGRVALSLKIVGGFSVPEIARAFLATDGVIAQRITRARRRLRDLDPAFELPPRQALDPRVDSVLEVIYLLFNEGYAAHHGEDLVRLDLCGEAFRLATLIAGSPVATPAAHALLALIAFQAARLPARVDEQGEIVLLDDQVRSQWDTRLTAIGFEHLDQSAVGPRRTPYHVQAAIAAAHAAAPSAAETPWPVILQLYDDLMALAPTPVIALNRVVAVWKARGSAEALAALRAIEGDPVLEKYHLLFAVKGRLLANEGDPTGARENFERALRLPCSAPERRLLRRQVDAIGGASA